LDTVLASIHAYNAGEIDRMLRFYAVDCEVIPDSGFVEIEPLHGRQSIRDWVIAIGSAWGDSVRYEIADARAIGADRVLVRGDWGGTGTRERVGWCHRGGHSRSSGSEMV